MQMIWQKYVYILLTVLIIAGVTYLVCLHIPFTYQATVLIKVHKIDPALASAVAAIISFGGILLFVRKAHVQTAKNESQPAAIRIPSVVEEEQVAATGKQGMIPTVSTMPLTLPETPRPFALDEEISEMPFPQAVPPRLSLPMRSLDASLHSTSLLTYSENRTSGEIAIMLVTQLQQRQQAPIQSSEQLI